MLKNIFENKVTYDIYGRPLSKKNKREPVSKSQKNELLLKQKNRCKACRNILYPTHTHFDHVKPIADGGRSIISNLQALCANCHNIKTHKDRLKKVEKKRRSSESGKDDYFINPITGKKEKAINIWKL